MTTQHVSRQSHKRMVGFAFALAHLLVETRLDGTITFAAGSPCGLVSGPLDKLVGQSLTTLALPADRPFLKEVLNRIANRLNTPAVRVALAGVDGRPCHFMLGGIRLEDGDIVSLGLVVMSGPASSAKSGDRMMQAAVERATHVSTTPPDAGGNDDGLMLLVVDEIAEMVRKGPIEAVLPVLENLRAFLRSVSVEGDAVKEVGSGKFGLVRAAGVSRDEVQAGIRRILDEFNIFTGIKVYDLSFDLSGDRDALSEEDIARTISYSIRRFSEESTEDYDIKSLRDGANAILQDTVDRLAMAREMLRQHNIDIVYQAVVNLTDSKVHHLEVLSRIAKVESISTWTRLAEESGLVQDLDLVVTAKIVESLKEFARAGWSPRLSLNLSAASLQSKLFMGQFEDILKSSTQRGQIIIQVTDSGSLTEFGKLAEILAELRRKGHAICLDDIGTEASSFERIRTLPANYIKIEGTRINGLAEGKVNAPVLQTVIKMAVAKEMGVIVNDLSTQEEVQTVRSLGVRYGQGFIFGRPVPDASAAALPEGLQVDTQWSPIPKDDRRAPTKPGR